MTARSAVGRQKEQGRSAPAVILAEGGNPEEQRAQLLLLLTVKAILLVSLGSRLL